MKIVSAQEMARIEKRAGGAEEAWMEAAGRGVADAAKARVPKGSRIILLCGTGNNGGDAYVAGSLLRAEGFSVDALTTSEQGNLLSQKQRARFVKQGGMVTLFAGIIPPADLLIDGIFGTGFHGKVEGITRSFIEAANRSNIPILAIDIPSGINGTTGESGGVAIHAEKTLCLGLPKIGCFLGEAWCDVGILQVHDFGLPQKAIEEAQADFTWLLPPTHLLPSLHRTRHKYERGYVIGVGGEMAGAPLLASLASLRAGAGLVRLFYPEPLPQAPQEVICERYDHVDHILPWLPRASSLFIGPGLGTSSAEFLQRILAAVTGPCILDADALTCIATQDLPLPPYALLTPHKGEMKRLLHLEEYPSPREWLTLCQNYSTHHRVIVILKGAPTFLFHPELPPLICTAGTPGMATAGSGDVLTGILAGVAAQLKEPWEAAQLGVYLHGLAGECAAENKTDYAMIASDIIEALPTAFARLHSS